MIYQIYLPYLPDIELSNVGSGAHAIYVDGSPVIVYCDMSKGTSILKGTLHFRNNLGSKDSLDPSE